jgi:hypothetical protein
MSFIGSLPITCTRGGTLTMPVECQQDCAKCVTGRANLFSTMMKNSVSDQPHPSVVSEDMDKSSLPPGPLVLYDSELLGSIQRDEGYPVNASRVEMKARVLMRYIERSTSVEDLKRCFLEYMKRSKW